MGASYRHTQIGWVLLVAVGLAAAAPISMLFSPPRTAPSFVMLGVLAVALLLFPTLTVVGGANGLEVRFGVGVIRKRISWAQIESATPVRNSWVEGWGIRKIPAGWMYNVSGFDAVQLRMKNGKMFRIGTDDPQRLHAFIEEQLAKTA